jgi:5-methylthioadenosine/S-adenosylhomocysteine deaminase
MILRARYVLPIEGEPIENGAVLVRKGKIDAVGKFSKLKKEYPEEEVKDFKDAAILPGFVDTHTHLEFSTFRGVTPDLPFWAWKLKLAEKSRVFSDGDWELSAEIGALEAIQSGITCIADITRTGAPLKVALKFGLRGIIFYEVSEMDAKKTDKVMQEAEEKIQEWKKLSKGSLLEIGISPYSAYNVAPPILKEVAHFSQGEKLLLATHLSGSKEEYDFVKYGSGPLAHQYREVMGWGDILWQPLGVSPVKYMENWDVFETKVLAVHCIQMSDYDIDVLNKYDVSIAHCPRTSAKLGMGVAPLSKFFKRGMIVGLGTDSPASNFTMDFFDEMRVGILLQRGVSKDVNSLSARKFVQMATLEGARALRMDGKIGSLKPGKEADIIVVDLSEAHQFFGEDPYTLLVYRSSQENIILTMVKGEILYERGKFKKVSLSNIMSRVSPLKKKLQAHKEV